MEKPPAANRDVYPPGRVTDLKLAAMQIDKLAMTIEWTAPGDDLDTGTGFYPSSAFDDLCCKNNRTRCISYKQFRRMRLNIQTTLMI